MGVILRVKTETKNGNVIGEKKVKLLWIINIIRMCPKVGLFAY